MVPADGRATRGRGRPRDPTYDDAIRAATTELLAEKGYQGLTMIEVARRAGVAKTTIYRRWDTKGELVLDAVGQGLDSIPEIGVDESEKPLEALRQLVVRFYGRLAGRIDEQLPVEPARLLSETEVVEAFRPRFLAPVRQRGATLIQRARRRGQLDGEMDPLELMDVLIAPAMYAAMVLDELPRPEFAGRLFEAMVG